LPLNILTHSTLKQVISIIYKYEIHFPLAPFFLALMARDASLSLGEVSTPLFERMRAEGFPMKNFQDSFTSQNDDSVISERN